MWKMYEYVPETWFIVYIQHNQAEHIKSVTVGNRINITLPDKSRDVILNLHVSHTLHICIVMLQCENGMYLVELQLVLLHHHLCGCNVITIQDAWFCTWGYSLRMDTSCTKLKR